MKTLSIYLMILINFGMSATAHEGHDHMPGVISAPHGGVVQGTSQLYIELISDASGIKLYPLTRDLNPIPLKEIVLTGATQLPKKARQETITFTTSEDHYIARVNAKGVHRYILELTSTYKGKKEKLKFQVEPQN